MKESRKRKLKILLMMASVLLLMLALSGCRTRLTNNTEVNPTITDEDGWLQESYDMRRDALGSPVAKKPFLTGSPEDEEDDYDVDYDFDTSTEQEPDEPEPPEDTDEDDDKDTKTTTTSKTTKTTKKPGTTKKTSKSSTKKKSSSSSDKTADVEITLNANGGTPETTVISIKQGGTYGDFGGVVVTLADNDFAGWYTDPKAGTQVDFNTPLISNDKHTLFAHWTPKTTPPAAEEFDITWDKGEADSVEGDMPAKIKNGENFPNPMPKAKKKNYKFLGWFTADGTRIEDGQKCTSSQSIKAKFESWDSIHNEAAKGKAAVYVAEDGTEGLVRGTPFKDGETAAASFVIIKLNDDEYTAEKARAAAKAKHSSYPDAKIIVVPKNATAEENQIIYKLLLLRSMYGEDEGFPISENDITQAFIDTEATIKDVSPFTPEELDQP